MTSVAPAAISSSSRESSLVRTSTGISGFRWRAWCSTLSATPVCQ